MSPTGGSATARVIGRRLGAHAATSTRVPERFASYIASSAIRKSFSGSSAPALGAMPKLAVSVRTSGSMFAADRGDDPRHDLARLVLAGVPQQQRELVAADAEGVVAVADQLDEQRREPRAGRGRRSRARDRRSRP